ncbi:MAG: hypothetical protein ACLFU8_14080 [Anaerolineales bacterium]
MMDLRPEDRPHLTFACELPVGELQALFDAPPLLDTLVDLRATVALGILDLTPERAEVVRQLNGAGVPVVAWQLLPEEAGYWFNVDNAPRAVARYGDFVAWTRAHELVWAGVGLDIETDIRDLGRLLAGDWKVLLEMGRRALDAGRLWRARAIYRNLVEQIRADGYPVEGYHFPIIVDERQAGSTLLQRLLGLVDIPVDREVLMLYTSFAGDWGPGMVWSYGPQADAIGVGSTGGGVELEGVAPSPPLTWEALGRDLRLARAWTDEVFIFSLEGCVRQGYLERLRDFDWQVKESPPRKAARKVKWVRRALRALLWAGARPGLLIAVFLALVAGSLFLRRLRRDGEPEGDR